MLLLLLHVISMILLSKNFNLLIIVAIDNHMLIQCPFTIFWFKLIIYQISIFVKMIFMWMINTLFHSTTWWCFRAITVGIFFKILHRKNLFAYYAFFHSLASSH